MTNEGHIRHVLSFWWGSQSCNWHRLRPKSIFVYDLSPKWVKNITPAPLMKRRVWTPYVERVVPPEYYYAIHTSFPLTKASMAQSSQGKILFWQQSRMLVMLVQPWELQSLTMDANDYVISNQQIWLALPTTLRRCHNSFHTSCPDPLLHMRETSQIYVCELCVCVCVCVCVYFKEKGPVFNVEYEVCPVITG